MNGASSGRLWPYSQTLDWDVKACEGQTLSLLLRTLANKGRKKFYLTFASKTSAKPNVHLITELSDLNDKFRSATNLN